jgi:hypothetical protein
MVHHGRVWADHKADLLPGDEHDWALWSAALLFSGFNVVGGYAFGRGIRAPRLTALSNPGSELAFKRWRKA